jgi:hypothetical protein
MKKKEYILILHFQLITIIFSVILPHFLDMTWKKEYALILHFQPIKIIFSAILPHFLDMTWKIETFLLVVSLKLINTNGACLLKSRLYIF